MGCPLRYEPSVVDSLRIDPRDFFLAEQWDSYDPVEKELSISWPYLTRSLLHADSSGV